MLQLRTASKIGVAALSVLCATSAFAGSLTGASHGPTVREVPGEFGGTNYTVTSIPAAAFIYQHNDGYSYGQCSCTYYQCGCFNGAAAWDFFAGATFRLVP